MSNLLMLIGISISILFLLILLLKEFYPYFITLISQPARRAKLKKIQKLGEMVRVARQNPILITPSQKKYDKAFHKEYLELRLGLACRDKEEKKSLERQLEEMGHD